MTMRRWERNIAPIVLAPKKVPIWAVFKKVPPALITDEGISWISSQIGDPVNNFVRHGLDVKVCLLRDLEATEVSEISITLEGETPRMIAIEYPQARSYRSVKSKKNWRVVDAAVVPSGKGEL
ncbi:hypothetical protein LINPERPRIM_LOCUS6432 [Linum perenne]